ncbi:MAG: tetratricopeptide repeat protein [Deltaproteobacteria bacterium]|nr:tetratricopeptide repeat protein [Deltaproteobacteria bacterium]
MKTLWLAVCCAVLFAWAAPRLEAQPVRPGQELVKPDLPRPSLPKPGDEIPDWQAWLELARLQSYVGQYDDSLASYAMVIREKPDFILARLERAKVMTWAGRQDEAWAELAAIPDENLDPEARIIMADILAARQDYAQAANIYTRQLQARPDDHALRLKLAEVLSWDGRYQESLDEYEVLLREFPDDVQLRRKYAFVLSWAGRQEDAIRELRETLPR